MRYIAIKIRSTGSLLLAAILLASPGFFTTAHAAKSPRVERALAQLVQAQGETDDTKRRKFLEAALKDLKKAGNDKKGPALALVQAAIADMNEHNTSKANDDIAQAIATIRQIVGDAPAATTEASTASPTPSPVPEHNAPTVKLTEDQARAVVVIKGDNAEGTGFLVQMPDGPVVVTNIHVISNNPHLQITTTTGSPITILSYKGATDRDLAMISVKDGGFSYLTLATDISATVQPGDEVVTPGNSEGGDVVLNTGGKVLGVGPDRIEFDNPVYHGNSGGPVFHVKSGKVIGVVTEAIKVDVTDELDKASFANRNSAIGHSMRYFGLRLDTAHNWETYDWNRFQVETLFLDQFDARNRSLDTYLNAPDDAKPEDNLWRQDDPVVKANTGYFSQSSGSDTSQQMDAARQWLSDMYDIANANMDAIQDPRNFYTFDQQRAKDALAYRKALKAELDTRSNNLSQLASMPRKNR